MNTEIWESLERAIVLAINSHCGQRDKSGRPYILHLLNVMSLVDGPIEKQVAVLHDYIEDVSGSVELLHKNKISLEAIAAIELLTKPDSSTYCDYVIRLSSNPIAKQVKLADLTDNYRIGRVAYRDEHQSEDSKRMQRYALSHQFLLQTIDESEYRRRIEGLE